ncbi:NAD(P)H quinone oxidoreductase [Acrocarpospora phusangensis]|uniref:NAD(P)H quinone oxidoreductase n=1 Tax=Acrocarpospora phusangensis TaxID=1070424 RepID=A0A919QCN5_9ACTN|nr:NAD(P)H-quinone oxidoreductase [Acrocarpospora phusangensis]GIH24930.1 NAD(P)H quinone oxidoreductase [Acrocarpospora phusangensis]
MRAIMISEPGGPDVLTWQEVPDPVPGRGEVVVDVVASAVNRADLLQRQGFYPPPKGASEIPGLECSGVISEIGPGVDGLKVGDEVTALLSGGGYAQRVAVPWQQIMPAPTELADSASLPEVACTVWSNVFMTARLRKGETLLVHGGASGIGTLAIQLAKAYGSRVIVTAGSAEKIERCLALGADEGINYREEDFSTRRADVILDIIGAKYLKQNVDALAVGGRLVVIGLQGGTVGELDLGKLLGKRASVSAAGLRGRPVDEKGVICRGVAENVWPLVSAGAIKPVIHAKIPMEHAAEAHRMLEDGEHVGKILLVS